MIYPDSFEHKIGFDDIRAQLCGHCLSTLGKEMVAGMSLSADADTVNEWLEQVREFRQLQEEADDFPLQFFIDMRGAVARLRLEGTHLEEDELFDLRRSLGTICDIVRFLKRTDDGTSEEHDGGEPSDRPYPYPALHRLTDGVATFPQLVQRIDRILDKYGKIRDNASPALLDIRRELARTEGSISRTLYNILRMAQSEGLVEKDAAPAMRDGRLVIPVAPGLKRKIRGIVHDESASGKTVFIEPTEVVEANNRIRELEAEERREIVRILKVVAADVRPYAVPILGSYRFLAKIDMIRAKAELARHINGIEPVVERFPLIDWTGAVNPLLRQSLDKQGKPVVPLDIMLTGDSRILIISGPNAGGKSVCLKTAGLLQYMLQCGLSVPISERSRTGIYGNIFIDIGDEQSMENDLSTYSGHLMNMKLMMKHADERTLILIDEFGTGTEPQIGGAIAESVLKQFCKKGAYGIITTHYQNLKHFADSHEGVANGAMLYDRHEMKALFQLQTGQPGSSFAIEIARKIGLPEEVIRDAGEIVGSDYIKSDKYLQDIVRDRRYWENKRQNIHQREKALEQAIARYEADIKDLEKNRREVMRRAKEQAEELLRESNRKIENTIREIKESQAEKEETRRIRRELDAFRDEVRGASSDADDDLIARKMRQIQQRKERREKRRREKAENSPCTAVRQQAVPEPEQKRTLAAGDTVRIKGLTSVGQIETMNGKSAVVIFGDMRSKISLDKLEYAEVKKSGGDGSRMSVGRQTRETIDSRKLNFKQDIDVRGMRGDEAINAVMYFIDDAILVGMSRVRILHGTGAGILKQLIRQYLATVPNVTGYKDEHVQFGGAGITVVDIG